MVKTTTPSVIPGAFYFPEAHRSIFPRQNALEITSGVVVFNDTTRSSQYLYNKMFKIVRVYTPIHRRACDYTANTVLLTL